MIIQKSVFRFRIRIQLGQWIRNPGWDPAGRRGPLKWKKFKKIHVKKDLLRAEGLSWSQNVLLRVFIEPYKIQLKFLHIFVIKSRDLNPDSLYLVPKHWQKVMKIFYGKQVGSGLGSESADLGYRSDPYPSN
jgi:hypothetical protein